MTSLQKALLGMAAFLAVLLTLIVVANLNQIDPNGAMTVVAGLMTGLVGAIVALNRKGKDDQ